ncbi:MAG: hypothetical protein E7645_03940 [Ruminococcaceae bacterium]|nr:hypothetical protein [Oscillospiraceae bacterium]
MKCSLIKALSLSLSLIFGLLTMSVLPISAAEPTDANGDEEYEAKKATYREKIMADDVTTDDLLIGSWVSFYSFDTDSYEYQLDQMAAAGINFNMFPRDFGSGAMFDAEYWNNVEEQYAKRNMVYQMNGSMAEKNIAIGVEYAAGKEHCIGYHVVDEPTADKFPEIARLFGIYREADQTRYPLVNLFPSYAPEWALGGTYLEHVTNYVQTVGAENIDYLSHDYYPFRDGGVVLTDIFADMEVLRSVAYENGKLKTHAFPQSTAWNGTRMPNIDEMRWNVYGYLAYGFKALSWFNLVCPGSSDTEGEGFRDSLIYRDGTIRDPELFAAWSELNWEVRGLSSILMNLDAAHAYHTDKKIRGVEYLPEDFFLQPGGGRNEFIISVMEPKEGDENYIMIFNKNTKRKEITGKFAVNLSSDVKWLEYFDPFIGEYIPVKFSDGMLTDTFKPGEGKLYRLRYDEYPQETEIPTEAPTEPATEEITVAPTEVPTQLPTEAPTESPSEFTTEAPSSKGCGGVISGMGVMISALMAAWCLRKGRKELAR